MKKKILSLCLVVAMLATAVVGASMAYLTDTEEAVNVMTLGNVDIEQIEQERDGEGDLVDFNNNKGLYPVTEDTMDGYDSIITTDNGLGGTYESSAFNNTNNVLDKIVTVKNTGKSDAFVRTLFAFEMKNVNGEWVDPVNVELITVVKEGLTAGKGILWPTDDAGNYLTIEVDGIHYIVGEYYYKNDSKLVPGEISHPSLTQIYLKSTVGNEWYEQCGAEYEILVLSQAAQTAGFADAETALDTAFAAVSSENAETVQGWFEGAKNIKRVSTVQELYEAMEAGGKVILEANITITPDTELPRGNYIAAIFEDTVLDLNGYNITFDLGADKASSSPRMFYVYYGDLTIKGEGTLSVTNDAAVAWVASGGGNLYIEGGNFVSDNHSTGNLDDIFAIIYSSGGEVHVYGGTFTYDNMPGGTNGGFNVQDWWGHKITLYEGVLLSNEVYRQPQDTTALRIRLDEGCTLKEVVIDGTTWYQVVKE